MMDRNNAVAVKSMPTKEGFWPDTALILTAFLLLFWGLGSRGLWGSEGRWAEVTREMFLTRDFFHPTIGGEPYFDKPLLTYWLIAFITAVTGRLNEWVVRLPSAVAGIVAIWATRDIGRRLWSIGTGRIAAWILLTTYGFLFWSRTAAADTENLAAITVAVAWYWSQKDQPNFKSFLVFYLILSLGALTKGLTAVVVPVLVIAPGIILEKRWRMLIKPSHLVALTVGCVIYLAPFAYASISRPDYHASGMGLVFKENIVRFFDPFDHKQPFYIYFYQLPLLLLPWSPIFIAAIFGVARSWKALCKETRWLLFSLVLIFLFFTLSGSRRSYYILPILPFCALLVGVFIDQFREKEDQALYVWGMRIQLLVMISLAAANLILPMVLPIAQEKTGFIVPRMLYVACAVIGLATLMSGYWLRRFMQANGYPRVQQRIWSMILVAAFSMGGFFIWQYNILDTLRTERSFLLELKGRLIEERQDRVGIYPRTDAKVCYYLDSEKPPQIISDFQSLEQFVQSKRPGVLIMQRRQLTGLSADLLDKLETMPKLVEKSNPWESNSADKEKWITWFLPAQ